MNSRIYGVGESLRGGDVTEASRLFPVPFMRTVSSVDVLFFFIDVIKLLSSAL